MHDFEWLLLVCVYAQPSILGVALFGVARLGLNAWGWGSHQRGVRRRLRSVRFFECAAYARLLGQLRYDLQVLALCAVFLLYDVDLVFFLAEATSQSWWATEQALLVVVLAALFALGLFYDTRRGSLMWAA